MSLSTKSLNSQLEKKLAQQQKSGRFRYRKIVESAQDVHLTISGERSLSFCSNDYLGLANHPRLVQRQKKALDLYGCGSGASHLISGHSAAHHALEEELAEFLGVEATLLFSSGYMANLGIINTILNREDSLFEDRLNHASLIDAGLFCQAKMKRYQHNDIQSLQRQLSATHTVNKLIVSDAVFSMDGDIAPIPQLLNLAKQYNSWLMLDDAHGFGVLGKKGRGSVEHYQLETHNIDIYMATLGKSMGVSGAFVAGSQSLIETLVQFSRTYTYTTAMPAVLAETLRESLLLLQQESWRREKLVALIAYFRKSAEQMGLVLEPSQTAIQPLLIGDNKKAMLIAEQLFQKGFYVTAIRPPTVPENTARLRITLSANHSFENIDRLLDSLAVCIQDNIIDKLGRR